MTKARQMILAVSLVLASALSGPAANAEVGVGIHVGGVGAGLHVNVVDSHRRHHRHYYNRHSCRSWGWQHHQRYCRRWH